MKILGLNTGHDSSAALIIDGLVMSASEEERFNRRKHSKGFPLNALKFCLNNSSIDINQVDKIAVGMQLMKRARSRFEFRFMESDPLISKSIVGGMLKDIEDRIAIEKKLVEDLGYKGEIEFSDHHDCHAAAVYYPSNFSRAAILTMDGAGEKASTRIYSAKNTEIKKILQVDFPDSLGLFYSLVTNHLGFRIDSGEGKVMGLSSFGDKSWASEMSKMILIKKDGTFELDRTYFNFKKLNSKEFSSKFVEKFGERRKKGERIKTRHENIAGAAQTVLEEVVLTLVKKSKELTGADNLCLSGGVVLNSVVNGKIVKENLFQNLYVYPASGDSGTAVGAALKAYYSKEKERASDKNNQSPFLGYKSSDDEIVKALRDNNLEFSRPDDIHKETASLIAEGNIIGWYSGRSEFGPRALGNRSILADPRQDENKDRINAKIKFRESFRPFAPSILEEYSQDFFETYSVRSPYMLYVFQVKKEKRKDIPAVTHIDNTSRVQTVNKEENIRYWKLINEFYKITGIPVLLNTSFNRSGEPIVNTPQHAVGAFLGSGLDVLVMEDYLVLK